MDETLKTLQDMLGISDERFQTKITPFMNKTFEKELKLDVALLGVESNKDLNQIEKIYCAYAIGRVVGIDEVTGKARAVAAKLGLGNLLKK
jgi:hypothetical protein